MNKLPISNIYQSSCFCSSCLPFLVDYNTYPMSIIIDNDYNESNDNKACIYNILEKKYEAHQHSQMTYSKEKILFVIEITMQEMGLDKLLAHTNSTISNRSLVGLSNYTTNWSTFETRLIDDIICLNRYSVLPRQGIHFANTLSSLWHHFGEYNYLLHYNFMRHKFLDNKLENFNLPIQNIANITSQHNINNPETVFYIVKPKIK